MISPATGLPRATTYGNRSLSRGFSLVELAVSLAVIGLITSAAAATYMGISRNGGKLGADARLASLSESVIAFARAHHRLPCPDSAGTGYEALACPAGTDVGWFPYLSIGLSQPATQERAIYGVYRNAVADLAANADPASLGLAATQTTANTYVYVTGDGTTANGIENCSSNVASNPAFVILAPGEDRSGDGQRVDGIHSALPASGRCFAAPSRGIDTNFDDRTIAVSSYAMMAKLNQ